MWRRYARLFGADPRADVDDELQFHLRAKTDDLIAQGWQPDVARREAERQFGDIQSVYKTGRQLGREREQTRRRNEYWQECIQDFRYALRTLRKDRSFAIVAVLILGLGIAANTAVFSIVYTVLLRPLPFPDAHQLAWLASGKKLNAGLAQAAGLSAVTYTVAAYEEFQRHNRSFQSVASYNPFFGNSEYTLTGRGEPQPIAGVMVSENFFQTLRVQPALGRLFLHKECQKGGPPAVLLSDAFWQHQFAGDPAIVGQAITLSNRPATVVGILPPTFDFGSVFSPGLKIDVYVPALMDVLRNWGNTLALVGRLRPGVSVAQAQAEADVLFPQLKSAHQDWWTDYSSTIIGLKEFVSGKLRRSLFVLWSAVGLILVNVCVNLSNLLIARAVARSKEFAVRAALGASRARLSRQLLAESLILACAGAIIGLVLAWVLTIYLARQGSIVLPLLREVRVDAAALAWTLAITILITLLFGFVPALKLAAGNLQDSL
jgi:predicted permease